MELKAISSGKFSVAIQIPACYLDIVKQSSFPAQYDVLSVDLEVLENAPRPYFEINLEEVLIEEVITFFIENGIEADFELGPVYTDENYELIASNNAHVRKLNDVFVCYETSKKDEDLAFEFLKLAEDLENQGNYVACEYIKEKSKLIYSLGWLV